jgi:cell wall-associated NlpC family hydrolase
MSNVSGLVGWLLIGAGGYAIYSLVGGRNPVLDLEAVAAGKPLPAATHLSLASDGSADTGSDSGTSSATGSSSTLRTGITNFALSKVGGAYRWGGNGPRNYDCSGLFTAAYASVGITVPRTSGAESAVATEVGQAEALPGDAVFYGKPAGHVGVYLGGGMMVAADNPSVGILHEAVYPHQFGSYGPDVWYGRMNALSKLENSASSAQATKNRQVIP